MYQSTVNRRSVNLALVTLLITSTVGCGAAQSVGDEIGSWFESDDEQVAAGPSQTQAMSAEMLAMAQGDVNYPEGDAETPGEAETANETPSEADTAAETPSDHNTSITVTRTESHTTTSESRSGQDEERSLESGGSADACFGDFYLGESMYIDRQAGIGQSCEGDMPMNCLDGMYVFDGAGNCVCTARCAPAGELCADGWTCREVQATNATGNRAQICAWDGWFLCST